MNLALCMVQKFIEWSSVHIFSKKSTFTVIASLMAHKKGAAQCFQLKINKNDLPIAHPPPPPPYEFWELR